MLFNSPIFLFTFLPLILLVYYLFPKRFKNAILLMASLGFYTWGEKELVVLIILSVVVDYLAGLIIAAGKRKIGLTGSIVFNLGILIYFKYANFVFTNFYTVFEYFGISIQDKTLFSGIILPLGISFYTFQTMSYTIDVYRGVVKPNKNIVNFATYVAFFPQLIAGPIVRYKEIETYLTNRVHSYKLFAAGVERFIIGLAKKMIIANNCAFLADGFFNMPANELSMPIAWLGVIAYAFQIYFDFSGYSDMAIGLGKMFGFNFPENFNYPYIARSIKEFWKRWHITLSNWFKDYLYISLGGNRKGTHITFINLLIVFFITGLWHGANWTFIVWGMLHGMFLIFERLGLEKTLQKLPKFITHSYTLFVVLITWVFFRSNTVTEAFMYIKAMFSFNLNTNLELFKFYFTNEVLIALVLASILSMPMYSYVLNAISKKSTNLVFSIKTVALICLFVVSIIYVASNTYNPFIYFRF